MDLDVKGKSGFSRSLIEQSADLKRNTFENMFPRGPKETYIEACTLNLGLYLNHRNSCGFSVLDQSANLTTISLDMCLDCSKNVLASLLIEYGSVFIDQNACGFLVKCQSAIFFGKND